MKREGLSGETPEPAAENSKPENADSKDPSLTAPQVPPRGLERKFAKDLAQELRDETARRLQTARKMPGNFQALRKLDETERPDYSNSSFSSETPEAIARVERSIFGKLFQTQAFKESLYALDRLLAGEKQSAIARIKQDYNNALEKVIRESPLSEEEMEKYLNEETMKSLSLEDYLTLQKRLSGNFVSHVTRYGVREQGSSFHSAGMGEFFDSFAKVLRSKKLESFMANFMTDPNSVPYVVGNMRKIKEQTGLSGEALVEKVLEVVEGSHDENMPADQSSVHGAVNDVASEFYGSEKGYDFYFYFPAEFIAYNYFHHHKQIQNSTVERQQGLTTEDPTNKHNDLAIWNEGRGVPIDAGITCIPKDVRVDPLTGSQYKLVDGKPVQKADRSGYELAENTISSQEFWENYFATNPDDRPSKVIYGKFTSMPDYQKTRDYQDLFQRRVFRTDKDLPDYKNFDAETFGRYKSQLADFVRQLEGDGVI